MKAVKLYNDQTIVTVNGHVIDKDVKLVYKPNPKKNGSKAHTRYEAYSKYETLADYLNNADQKYAMADLRFDVAIGHLALMKGDKTLNSKEIGERNDTIKARSTKKVAA